MTECEDLELKRRTAPEGSEKRGQKSGRYLPKRESKEERQLPVYQSDRIFREPQTPILEARNSTSRCFHFIRTIREFEACFSAASSRLRFSPNPTISGARRLCSRLFIFVLQSGHFVVRVSGKLENRFQLRRHAALVVLRNGFESLAKIPFFYSFYPVKFGGVEAQNLSFVFHGNVLMAEGYRYTDRNNQTQEHTNWHSLVFSGELPTSPRRTKRATASSSKERS